MIYCSKITKSDTKYGHTLVIVNLPPSFKRREIPGFVVRSWKDLDIESIS